MPLDSIIPLNTGQRNMHEDVRCRENLKRTYKCLKIDEIVKCVTSTQFNIMYLCKNDALEAAY